MAIVYNATMAADAVNAAANYETQFNLGGSDGFFYGAGGYGGYGITTSGSFVHYNPNYAEKEGMKTSTKTVRLIAGYVGQVFVYDTGDIVWESSPKKTLTKADKAAKKAQLRAVKRSYA